MILLYKTLSLLIILNRFETLHIQGTLMPSIIFLYHSIVLVNLPLSPDICHGCGVSVRSCLCILLVICCICIRNIVNLCHMLSVCHCGCEFVCAHDMMVWPKIMSMRQWIVLYVCCLWLCKLYSMTRRLSLQLFYCYWVIFKTCPKLGMSSALASSSWQSTGLE